jgi:integrase
MLAGSGHRDATMVLVAYRHGLRAAELVTLRWDAIDFAHGRLHVRRLKGGSESLHPLYKPFVRNPDSQARVLLLLGLGECRHWQRKLFPERRWFADARKEKPGTARPAVFQAGAEVMSRPLGAENLISREVTG